MKKFPLLLYGLKFSSRYTSTSNDYLLKLAFIQVSIWSLGFHTTMGQVKLMIFTPAASTY